MPVHLDEQLFVRAAMFPQLDADAVVVDSRNDVDMCVIDDLPGRETRIDENIVSVGFHEADFCDSSDKIHHVSLYVERDVVEMCVEFLGNDENVERMLRRNVL